ncbi:porin family protein [Limibacter armeniacum]|uniref:porin family protein n=1 Tax=Limibacter armeniacum TaxID=466084 RepID=UPI002FE5337B
MTKKLFFVIATVLGIAATANAQTARFGIKGGANFANIKNLEAERLVGLNAGGMLSFRMSEGVGIQPEVIYSQQGAKREENNVTVKSRLNYLNVPVMLKFYLTDGFNLQMGPQVGFLLDSKLEAESGSLGLNTDFEDNTNEIDYGVNFGAAIEGREGFYLEGRYTLGMKDIMQGNASDNEYRNNVVSVSVGYFMGR